MNKIKLKKTFSLGDDLTINRIGFGAMRITGKGIWGQPENKTEAIKVLRSAIDLGVNFIDTADSYGPNVSEELIAEAFDFYPKDLVIGTKGGFLRTGPNQWAIDASPTHLEDALNGSLRRLKLYSIDLYQLHRIDLNVPAELSFGFLKKAQEQGKIKHIGLSEVSVDEIKLAQQFFNVVSVQNKYSVDYRNWESVLEYCNQNHIAFIPWNPINAGNLSKLDLLNKIAIKYNTTAHQIALYWLLNHSNNILLIPGTSSVKHLEENMECDLIRLSEEDIKLLNALSDGK